MLSPDGKWVWDGQQWQPIAQHESVFPSWQSIAVEPAAPAAPAAPVGPAASPFPVQAPVPTPYPVRAPAVVQPINPALLYPQQAAADVPLWERGRQARPGMTPNYLYFVAGLVVIVIVLVVLNSVFPLWLLLPGPKPAPAAASPRPSPLPALTQRSDYTRVNYFITVIWPSTDQTFAPAVTSVAQLCTRELTNSCQDALTAADPQVTKVLAVIDANQMPLCVAPQAAKLRSDVVGMQSALKLANRAFTDNQASELASAIRNYDVYLRSLGGDLQNMSQTATAQCDTRVTGP
jgi:hypothetical protein